MPLSTGNYKTQLPGSICHERRNRDSVSSKTNCFITKSFGTGDRNSLPFELTSYNNSYIPKGLLLYKKRVEVPLPLRPLVGKGLYAAKQVVSSMKKRAHAVIVWPGISNVILTTRKSSVGHRISLACNPRCNGGAEVTVKQCDFCGITLIFRGV